MSVAVNINNQKIRVLAAERNRITHWETAELPAGLVKDGQIIQPEATAKILKEVLERAKIGGGEVNVCITGMSFVYRILGLPRIKNADLREAIERATQKEINLPLNDLYIDWQVIGEKADSLEIFVLGAPRVMVDAVVQTFKLANLKLTSLEINSLALARLVNQTKALIADFGTDWFDIVIVSEGLPVTLHSVATRGNFRELEDSLSQMTAEIRRTVDFFNLTHKENTIKPGEAVFLSGINKSSVEAGELLDRYLPEAVTAPNGHMVYPVSFRPAEFAVLLGLVLRNQAGGITSNSQKTNYRDISINLLTGRRRVIRNPVKIRQLLLPAALIAAIILLTPLLLVRNAAKTDIAHLESQLNNVNRELKLRRMSISETEATEKLIAQYINDRQRIEIERATISGPGNLAASLQGIRQGLTDSLVYTSIISTAGQISVEGRANNRSEVLDFTSYLDSLASFAEVRIGSIEDILEAGEMSGQPGFSGVSFRIILARPITEK